MLSVSFLIGLLGLSLTARKKRFLRGCCEKECLKSDCKKFFRSWVKAIKKLFQNSPLWWPVFMSQNNFLFFKWFTIGYILKVFFFWGYCPENVNTSPIGQLKVFNWRKGESSAETWHPLPGPFMKEMVEVKGERSERPTGTVHLLGSWKWSRERPPSALKN